ncbi:hypothetical protein HDU76_004527, partial [Blyttiomyces sp. JEL0837]
AFTNPGLLVPGVADRLMLQPFYDAVANGIREVDRDTLIFFESVTWDNFFVGFDHVPGGKEFAEKSVLSVTFSERMNDMKRLGCGGMLTEFEMGWQNGANVEPIRQKSQSADSHLFSYMGWEYTDYIAITGTNNGLRDPSNGQVRPDMANVYSRTYATAISGTPTSMKFDDSNGTFELVYVYGGNDAIATEIRLNLESHYPGGYHVTAVRKSNVGELVVLNGAQAVGAEGFVYIVGKGIQVGDIVTVTILRN